MNKKFYFTCIIVGLLMMGLAMAIALPTQVARAATITVTTTADGTGGPYCTLRDAITAADTDTATGGCPAGAGADTIVLASGATYTLTAAIPVNPIASASKSTPQVANGVRPASRSIPIFVHSAAIVVPTMNSAGIPANSHDRFRCSSCIRKE